MATNYPSLVRQDGFQLPSPTHTATTSEPTSPPPHEETDDHNNLFMPHNISFLPEPFRKFPSAAQAHAHHQNQSQQIDFTEELAGLIDSHPHASSHERSTHSRSPHDDQYRHNIFDISAPTQNHHQDIYQHDYAHFNSTLPALNSSMRYEPHPDPPPSFAYRHSPSPTNRSRSRSRGPSVGPGPTRSTRRERRTNSISSHVSSTSPPPRPHPHAIVIPGRTNPLGNFFVPNGTNQPQTEYSLPTPDSLSHSFSLAHSQHSHSHPHQQPQYPYAAPSSPYYPYQSANRASTPSMGISPTDVETLSGISLAHHLASSAPVTGLASSIHPSSLPTKPAQPTTTTTSNKSGDPDVHLSEKRRRRRESHNAVERRRRDNINERISELAGLIPGVLFECDGPLVVPGATPPGGASAGSASGTSPNLGDDLFTLDFLGTNSGMHVLPADDGLPDLPEEGSGLVKKDPSEERDGFTPASPTISTAGTHANGTNGNSVSDQTMIKANKGMILRKSVEYIRYLQQLVSVQASRGRDLEERNRVLERDLAALRGDILPLPRTSGGSTTSSSSISPSDSSPSSLSVSGSASSKHGSAELDGVECVEDLEMEDGDLLGDGDEHDEPSDDRGREEGARGRRMGRPRESAKSIAAGRGNDEGEGMDI